MHSETLVRALPLEVGALTALLAWVSVSAFTHSLSAAVRPRDLPPASSPAKPSSVGLSPIFARPVQFWGSQIQRWAHQYGLDPDFAATVMQIESCGNPKAKSNSGALGLFQVMPFHFRPGEDGLDPETNAQRGLTYLVSGLQEAHGQAALALAAYNGGPARLTQGREGWPSETQRYVYWGTGIYQDARSGSTSSRRLQEWREAGGSRLCQQAAQVLGLPGVQAETAAGW
ncbi:MAG: transglycosylase SLT domain-containing protein [Anaerolineales bacterium]